MSILDLDFYDLACRLGPQPGHTLALAERCGVKGLLTPPDEAVGAQNGSLSVRSLAPMTANLDGEQLAEMARLQRGGAVGVGQGYAPWKNTRVQLNAMRYAKSLGLRVFLSPLDPVLGLGVAHDGAVAQRLGLETQPSAAETIALARDLQLVAETGVTAHMGRLSSAESVRLMARAKHEGLDVTCDVAITHLLWDERQIEGYDFSYRLQPVLRSDEDRQALIAGVESGVIDAIVSDHTPWPVADKRLPFAQAKPGTETLALWRDGVNGLVRQGALSGARAEQALNRVPRSLLGL